MTEATPTAPPRTPELTHIKDPNVHGNRNFWSSYAWPEGGDEWSKPWGGTDTLWHCGILPRIRHMVPAGHILEIAPGFGRCTQYLRSLCTKLTIVDLVPKCIEACRERFAGDPRIEYHVNDGRSLAMVPDNSVDFAFSWDSLVHAEHETVREYLGQLRHKLKPGAIGFIHHSNLGAHTAPLTGKEVLGGRRPSMSAEKFRDDCREFGLRCVSQELVPWTGEKILLDSISVFVRDEAGSRQAPKVVERWDWRTECENARRIGTLYPRPDGPDEG